MFDDEFLRQVLLPIPEEFPPPDSLKAAAVLAPVFRRDGEDRLLFTLRHTTLVRHGGQVAFPGGMRDRDENPLACALRETEEEIGLAPEFIHVLGSLPQRQSNTGYLVTPLVARVRITRPLTPNPSEVERLLEASLAHLSDPTRWQQRIPPSDPTRPPGPHFMLDGATLFGLTARVVLDLMACAAGPPQKW